MKRPITVLVSLSLFVACAGSQQAAPGTAPDDMSAEEHRSEAQEHEDMAEEHEDMANTSAKPPQVSDHMQEAKEHSDVAEQHEEAADKAEQ